RPYLHGFDIGTTEACTQLGWLVAVKLQQVEWDRGQHRTDGLRLRVDEKPHDGDKRRKRSDDRAGLLEPNAPRRPGPEDDTDRVGTRVRGCEAVLDTRDAADLDARSRRRVRHDRGTRTGATVGGRFQCVG